MWMNGKTGWGIGQHGERTRGSAARLARLLLPLMGVLGVILAGCAQGDISGTKLAANQVFTWPYAGVADKINYGEILDPACLSAAADAPTIQMIYVGLVSQDANLNVQPDAAERYEVDKTGTVYTFHLRPNMKFSDGKPITAQDFAYSINRALDPTIVNVLSAKTYGDGCTFNGPTYLSHILGATARAEGKGGSDHSLISNGNDPNKGLNVIDPLTLQIRLDAPAAYFLQALTYPTSFALEQSFVENPQYAGGTWVDHLDQAGCSGPFKVKSYGLDAKGNAIQMTLEANPAWQDAWGKQLTLKQIVRPVVASGDDAYDAYRKGQYDYADVPANAYDTSRYQGDFHELPTLSTRYFGMNTLKAPFDNVLIRRAFALALNKQLLVDRTVGGGGIPTNHFIPKGLPGYNPRLKNPPPDGTQSLTGNQVAAQDQLAKAKASCPPPASISSFDKQYAYCRYISGPTMQDITVTVRDKNRFQFDITTAAVQQWTAVLGLNIKIEKVPFKTILKGINRESSNPAWANPYQIWNIGWLSDYTDPQDWLSILFVTGQANNGFGFTDPNLDKLLATADTAPVATDADITQRMALYNQAEQQIMDAAVCIPYLQGKFAWRQRPWVRGFGLNPLQSIPDVAWANVAILEH